MSTLNTSVQQNISGSGNIFTATGDVFVIQKPESATDRQIQADLKILLNKVRVFWVHGVLEKSIHHAVLLNLEKEVRIDSVDHPWGMVLELPNNERHTLPPKTDIVETFDQSSRALLILGEPGSGKTTTLLDLARKLLEKAEQDISVEPIPVVFNLSSWDTSRSLFDWLIKELSDKYQIPKQIGKSWLEQNRILPLLDGFDEIAETYRQNCVNAINEFIGDHGLPGLVVCSRVAEYTKLPVRLKLNAAICVQPLTDKQINKYLKLAIGKSHSLKELLSKDKWLYSLAKTPLFLSILCLAHRSSPEEVDKLRAGNTKEYVQKIFDIYFERTLRRKGGKFPYTLEQTQKTLTWLAKRMVEKSQSAFYIEQLQPIWLPLQKERFAYYILSRILFWFLIGFWGATGFISLSMSFSETWILSLLIGAASGIIFGPSTAFSVWKFSQTNMDNEEHFKPRKTSGIQRRMKGWAYFVHLQWIIFVLLEGVHRILLSYFFEQSFLFDSAASEIFSLDGGSYLVAILFTLFFLLIFLIIEAVIFFLFWKFRESLIFSIDMFSSTIMWSMLIFVLLSLFSRLPFIYAILGILILCLLLIFSALKSNKFLLFMIWIFNKFSSPVLSALILVAGFILASGETGIYFSFLIIGAAISFIMGFKRRYKERLKDIRTTGSISWSWKRSLPFFITAIISLLLFVWTMGFKNNVTLWDTRSGERIAILQNASFIHWNASYNDDGSRIVLLGGKTSIARAYLYDSLGGALIAEMGEYPFPAHASFNKSGSRLLVEGSCSNNSDEIETGRCYAQLWNTKIAKIVNLLNVSQALGINNLERYNLEFDDSRFTDDGYLIYHWVRLSDPNISEFELDKDINLKIGYIIWDAETGVPILFIYTTPNQDSFKIYLEYINPQNQKTLAVEISQISEIMIYDDFTLKQHPITIRNLIGGQNKCYWYVKSQDLDCTLDKLDSNIVPWEPYTFEISKSDQGKTDIAYSQGNNSRPPDVFLPRDLTTSPFLIAMIPDNGTVIHDSEAIDPGNFPVDDYPFSQVDRIENPKIPQLMTITDGNNPLGYGFGYLFVFAIILLLITGINTNEIEKTVLPNQGILSSLRNSLILGGLTTVVFGLITGILYSLLSDGNKLWIYTFGFGLLGGTIVWALYGGMDVTFHYTLRFILAKRGYLPLKLIPFLDYCADNLLLQKVGGGYIFIHRMLLENLAKKQNFE